MREEPFVGPVKQEIDTDSNEKCTVNVIGELNVTEKKTGKTATNVFVMIQEANFMQKLPWK